MGRKDLNQGTRAFVKEFMKIDRILIAAAVVAAAIALAPKPVRAQAGAEAVVAPAAEAVTPTAASVNLDTTSPFDQRIAERVVTALSSDPSLGGAVLRVSARDGNVTVSGASVDGLQVSRIQQLVDSIVGVGHASVVVSVRRP